MSFETTARWGWTTDVLQVVQCCAMLCNVVQCCELEPALVWQVFRPPRMDGLALFGNAWNVWNETWTDVGTIKRLVEPNYRDSFPSYSETGLIWSVGAFLYIPPFVLMDLQQKQLKAACKRACFDIVEFRNVWWGLVSQHRVHSSSLLNCEEKWYTSF